MRRKVSLIVAIVTVVSLLLAACAPAAAPTQSAPVVPNTSNTEPAEAEANMTGLPEVNPAEVTGNVITAGSSTVYPLSEAVVNLFKEEGYTGEVTIDSIGTGGGFERFCSTGETDIANASRPIKDSEREACEAIGRDPIEFRVGTDALAIVVNPANNFLTNVTIEELAKIFSDQAETWADVNPEWPAQPIKRYAPGTDSGTYDFFIEAVMMPAYDKDEDAAQAAFQNASSLQSSEDDNVLVQGIEGDEYAIGFFGYAYYQENADMLNILTVNEVEPSLESAESGEYPLSRPLYIYSDATILKDKPQVADFIAFYLTRVNEVVEEAGYFPASEQALQKAQNALLGAIE